MKSGLRYGLPMLGLTILSFFLGSLVVEFRLFPYSQFLGPVFEEGRAYFERQSVSGTPEETNLWFAASDKPVGVTVNNVAGSFEGYTLFTTPLPNGAGGKHPPATGSPVSQR